MGEPLSWIAGVLSVVVAWEGPGLLNPLNYLGPVVTAIVVGMVVHELMHRNVARRYGMSSQYVINWFGVLITLISAFLPIKLLAPGYTKIYAYGPDVSRRGLLRSVAAGPAVNIVMSIVTLVAALAVGRVSAFAYYWLVGFSEVNAYLALFNLLPIPPLDGSKIFSWDIFLWAIMIASSAALFAVVLML